MYPIENDGTHIAKVIDTTTCKKHKAGTGTACWLIQISITQRFALAVCGARIKRAGYNGKIQPSSLSQKEKAIRGSAPNGRKTYSSKETIQNAHS